MTLEIWTDGSAWPNPGRGSWAFVLIDDDTIVGEGSGFQEDVTNNRMEYMAVIEAFRFITNQKLDEKYEEFTVFSDSNLLVQTFNIWMANWKRNGWQRKTREGNLPVKNLDLVKQLDAIKEYFSVGALWVKGHAGNKWNEHVDKMCRHEFKKRGFKSFEDLKEEGRI